MIVVFSDLDGTLEDSRQDMSESVVRVRHQLGLPAEAPTSYAGFVNKGMDALYRTCFSDFLAMASKQGEGQAQQQAALERIRLAYEADYLAHVANHTRLYEGVYQALETLSQRAKIVVITNKPEHISRALLNALGVGDFICDVMGGDSCPENKPSPLPLQVAAKRLGFNPAQGDKAVMMGDTLADINAGKAFGAHTLWCAWGYLADPGDNLPDARLQHPRDIPDTVFTLCKA